ncbi:DUF2711 domain-containing protein [Acinetobacter gyllenbergii]|uniref:DUF2711 domain-containing protein n=1 Tax=Acinetobacter gyllenbergii TaxID=134534 RepID=UPI0021D0F56B|nr:DUF2711 domain-containing protein [Acinetobacter gyllenbergii]MCU4582728.1 DUF2711 domain-containing protein [Acinetobacter gyllenbergii]
MTNRILPTPEKFASCPYDKKILSFYEGQFESVFVIFHPFFMSTKIELECFCPSRWPSKHQFIEGCSTISWSETLLLSGLTTFSDIDIGLRTIINGIKPERSNKYFSEKLTALQSQHIILPQEGYLSPFIENKLLNAIKIIGHNWLWVGDEFGTERKLYWVEDLIEKDEIPAHGCVFAHDHSLLITTHWDSHCSFLCSSKETIDKILEIEPFEGFFCTQNTEVYWSLYEI